MKNRVLLTGAAGFIGSHILEHILVNTDWDVVCICSWKHKGTPERIDSVLNPHPEWKKRVDVITHDLVAPFTEYTKKRIGQIDYVINAAADSHVDRSIQDPVPFIQNNVNLMLTMLEWAREAKPKVFLQVSTDEVYGAAPKGHNHKEWEPIIPSNPYSASKAAQEAIAISYWRTYGVPLVITNTMNNFGETQDPEKYTALIVRKLFANEPITVHGTEDGNFGSRFYLHARNHADAILFLLEQPVAMYGQVGVDRPDRYNVVGDREINNLELAQMVAGMLNKPLDYIVVDYHSKRPGHDLRYALDGEKLANKGWEAPYDLETSLKKSIDWTLEHPQWL